MKMWAIYVFALLLGALITTIGIASGWSPLASWFLVLPLALSIYAAMTTVDAYGSPEQKREAFASFIVYVGLAVLTATAYFLGDPAFRGKFVDALLFGQIVPLLSVAKLCLNSWAAPTVRETDEERAERLRNARAVRKANDVAVRSSQHRLPFQ